MAATVYNVILKYNKGVSTDDYTFEGFYLGATLFGITIGPSLLYRFFLVVLFSGMYIVFIIYNPRLQHPLSAFIITSHFVLYFSKIYTEERSKRMFFIETKKVNFWEHIL